MVGKPTLQNMQTNLGSDLLRSPYINKAVTFFGEVETSLPLTFTSPTSPEVGLILKLK